MIRTPSRLVLVLALAGSLALAGCGGDDKKAGDKPKASPSATAGATAGATSGATGSPAPSPTPNKPPVEPPDMPTFAKGDRSKEAFAMYVVDAWAYALATNDATLLNEASVGGKPCQGCAELAQTLKKRTEEGWSVYPFEVEVTKLRLIESALGTTARLRVDIPENKSFFDDGTYRNTSPAHPATTFTLSLRKAKKSYALVGFTIS